MKRRLLVVLAVVVLTPIVLVAGFLSVKAVRDSLRHEEVVTIRGQFMHFACDYCYDMKVLEVRPARLAFVVGDYVEPYSDEIDVGDYIASVYKVDEPNKAFCMTGYLHKYKNTWDLIGSPSVNYPMLIETIDYAESCS